MIYWDMTFGLGVADWDVLLSDDELDLFFRQLAVVNLCRTTTLALIVHWKDAPRVAEAMEKHGFGNVHPFYTYKPMQNQRGVDRFIFSVEMILVGYMAAPAQRHVAFGNPNPLFRHNLLFTHSVPSRWNHTGSDEAVNTCQKPPGIARRLASIFCPPGSTALVVGAGSGSDVIGCIQAGCSVVAVERDLRQFPGCSARLVDFKTNFDQAALDADLEMAQEHRLQTIASTFAAWRPDDVDEKSPLRPAASGRSAASQGNTRAPDAPSPPSGIMCPSCGQDLGPSEGVPCGVSSCNRGTVVHAGCQGKCEVASCGIAFCCRSCGQAHMTESHPDVQA